MRVFEFLLKYLIYELRLINHWYDFLGLVEVLSLNVVLGRLEMIYHNEEKALQSYYYEWIAENVDPNLGTWLVASGRRENEFEQYGKEHTKTQPKLG